MSKKPDPALALLLVVARAVERMTRMGVAKELNAEIVQAIADASESK